MAKNNVSQKNNKFENFSEKCQCAARARALRSLLAQISKTVQDILINLFSWKVLALDYILGNIWILI